MVVVHSATKGLAAMTLAISHSRRWLDYEERVSTYWPEFAQRGKERITVRQLLAHQAGLFAFDEPVDRSVVADPDRLAVVMARQKPAWEPGTRQGYHALTLGFFEGELLRRVDPQHRSLGQFFQTKSVPRSHSTSTFDCRKAPPMPAWPHLRPPDGSKCCWVFRSGWRWRP
jgi:CubicO group peptidase (beta-lactamase class C family)